MKSILNSILILLVSICTIYTVAFSQQFVPGTSVLDTTGYVEYIPGNLPVIISVPHGGYLEPSSIPQRNCSGCTYIRDAYTQELARSLQVDFFNKTGCYPHVIINLLHRNRFDANRSIATAADSNVTVEQSWYAYHEYIDSAKAKITRDYGKGLFIDLHGHGHTIQRLELGYTLSKAQLQLSDSALDSLQYVNMSSIKSLTQNNLLSLSHSQLLRGPNSFGTLNENKGIPAVPSILDPFPVGTEPYFSGGYNTDRHGSVNGGTIDAIQIECNQDVRFDSLTRALFADSLTDVINEFINLHYINSYIGSYCNLTNNICKNNFEEILIFPNPANQTVYFNTKQTHLEVSIYDLVGNHIHKMKLVKNTMDISFLKKGAYLFYISKDNRFIGVNKVIKR